MVYKCIFENEQGFTVNEFINSLDLAKTSKQSYRMGVKLFLNWLNDKGITEPEKQNVIDYKQHLINKDLSTFSQHVYLCAIRSFFRWLEKTGQYSDMACDVLADKFPKGKKFYRKHLTAKEIHSLLKSVHTTSITGLRDYAIINLLSRTGIRSVEASRANLGDIKKVDGELRLYVQQKGSDSKDHYVRLMVNAHEPIRNYLTARLARGIIHNRNDPLFVSEGNNNIAGRLSSIAIGQIIKRYMVNAGFGDGYSCHSLRHSAVTLAIGGGSDIIAASRMTGHSNPKTTMLYNHNTEVYIPAEESIDKVLESAIQEH